ncbi:MAG: AI-2E family transporter [Actinomycetota bacterium]|nr:AI-2E family transporter [Actinomycetota bacterium]
MTEPNSAQTDVTLRRLGMRAWWTLGILALAAVVYAALSFLSGIVVPLIVAVVIGILFAPLVDRLSNRMHRGIASGIALVALMGVGTGTMYLTVRGIVDQAPLIQDQVLAGLEALATWLSESGIGDQGEIVASLQELISGVIPGVAGWVTTAFSGIAAFAIGVFAAFFILYFVLSDWDELTEWVASHMGVSQELGEGIIEDTVWSMRQYFYVLTISSLITGVLIGGSMGILGLPLAFAVGIVTFLTSYIPYLGAFFSGTFAFLIALGAGGLTDAVIILVAVLVVQNVVQPIVQTKWTESALSLHPIVTFGSTIVGAAVAGILGAALSAPIVAMVIKITGRLKEHKEPEEVPAE